MEKPNENSIEQNMTALEEIVRKLEDGSLPLEDSLKEFEKGVKLVQNSNVMLNEAEKKLQVLREDGRVSDF